MAWPAIPMYGSSRAGRPSAALTTNRSGDSRSTASGSSPRSHVIVEPSASPATSPASLLPSPDHHASSRSPGGGGRGAGGGGEKRGAAHGWGQPARWTAVAG